MENFKKGLRCQDVHAGLRGVDPNSAPIAGLSDTRIVGMAASVATVIRGRDVIPDAQVLKIVAADQLDVDPLAFEQVISILEAAGFVEDVQRQGGKIRRFTETVPFHQDLYEGLGDIWSERSPTQIEEELVATIDRLAAGPVAQEDLVTEVGLDRKSYPQLMEIGTKTELVKRIDSVDGPIIYSPFHGFENPEALLEILARHGPARFQEEFGQVRSYQGLPLDDTKYPALADAVGRGLLMAPAVQRPDKAEQAFVCAPYLPDHAIFTVKKTVLDKALAVVSCVRCGQHFGGSTPIGNPGAILDALLEGRALKAHSSHRRQYQILFRMQVMDFEPSGDWVRPSLIDTEDNSEAVRIARDLI